MPCRVEKKYLECAYRGGANKGTGEGTAKTKSYCLKHREYKKREVVDNHGGINHREILRGVLPPNELSEWVCRGVI